MTAPTHPARFSDRVLEVSAELLSEQMRRYRIRPLHVLDPFAGTGRVHELPGLTRLELVTYGVELEPEWAAMHPRTTVGNATRLPKSWAGRFDVVVTSPCYGSRMADHHEAADRCKHRVKRKGLVVQFDLTNCPTCKGSGVTRRRTYRHDLGRPLTAGSAGGLQWGDKYRELHEAAWREVRRVLRPPTSTRARGGLFVLNVKDHIRHGERQAVSVWHRRTVEALGFELVKTRRVQHSGMGFGVNRDARVPYENIYAFRLKGARS